ncbi:MAG: LysM peptidoglycan-binding domain-containing protein [Zoogloeaceae bacterium]|jgi:membrane-bound lytic murein transglycosylase D|nr:LysM peptidoglycan-binding domain-containing protein [Zoogloeaceae bacterium]
MFAPPRPAFFPSVSRYGLFVFLAIFLLFAPEVRAEEIPVNPFVDDAVTKEHAEDAGQAQSSADDREETDTLSRFLEAQALGVEEVRAPVAIPLALDLTAPTDDLWERIRNGFAMPTLNNDQVLAFQQYYQSHPEYLRRMVERSRLYMHHIVEELERRNMPMEIALLPMVESAYNPMALSPARASGLWQFIPSTGRQYRLEQNWWRDERRDVVASTSAALDDLQYIYEMHGDWHLALASYNWGEGAVGRAVAKNAAQELPTDYANLTMPNETRNYVPKLQALKNIFSNPRLMTELGLPPIPNTPYFHTLVATSPIDVKLAAQFAGLTLQEFIALNPSHNRPVIQANTTLVIPADRVEHFKEALENHDGPLVSWQTYALRPRERLEDIAPRFGITLADLKQVNGLHNRRARVAPGLTLLVPGVGNPDSASLDFLPVMAEADAGNTWSAVVTHRVKKGETLAAIARKYRVRVKDLQVLNRLKGSAIRPGMRLTVRRAAENRVVARQGKRQDKARKSVGKTASHTIRKGDTLFSIAKRYKVGVGDLKRWNKQAGKALKIGGKLTIRKES